MCGKGWRRIGVNLSVSCLGFRKDSHGLSCPHRSRPVALRRRAGDNRDALTLRTVLASLAEGASTEEIIADFPTLTPEDARAVVAFAAASTEEDLPVPNVPAVHAN